MQNRKSKEQLFTQADWDEADGTDKLYLHLMQPYDFPLSDEQGERLEGLREVWAIMCKHGSQRKRIRLISEIVRVTERTAYRYMDEAKYLFGDIFKVDADFELGFLKEQYYLLAEKAKKDGKHEIAKKCFDSAREIVMDIKRNTPKEKRPFAAVLFTDNPKALTQNIGDADEIEYEDLEKSGLLELQAVAVPADQEGV